MRFGLFSNGNRNNKVAKLTYDEDLQEILGNVIQNELNLIITTGYVLGGLIGVCTFGLQKLLGL